MKEWILSEFDNLGLRANFMFHRYPHQLQSNQSINLWINRYWCAGGAGMWSHVTTLVLSCKNINFMFYRYSHKSQTINEHSSHKSISRSKYCRKCCWCFPISGRKTCSILWNSWRSYSYRLTTHFPIPSRHSSLHEMTMTMVTEIWWSKGTIL